MRFPFNLFSLGLSTQTAFKSNSQTSLKMAPALSRNQNSNFALKEGADIFSPQDLISLRRPGAGVANDIGDLVLGTYTKYSVKDKKNIKTIYLAPLESTAQPFEFPLVNGGEAFWMDNRTIMFVPRYSVKDKKNNKSIYLAPLESTTQPLEIPLAKGGEAFSVDSRTIAHDVEDDGNLDAFVIDLKFETTSESAGVLSAEPPKLIGSFPWYTASNFQYSAKTSTLVFSDSVYADGNLTAVKEQDEAWENRGNTAMVFDETYERHWDTWAGPKTNSLFSVHLGRDADGKWRIGTEYSNLLRGTGHRCPVEPFGGTDDFSVVGTSVLYTTKDATLPQAWHTKQNVYIVDTADPGNPKELTSGQQGATHSPVLNSDATKAAWLELAEDGYEADKANIVVYDLVKGVRFTLIQKWDRSPDSIAFSMDGKLLYLTAGEHARIKVFVLPIPPTPAVSATHPDLPHKFHHPVALVRSGAVSGIQPLPNGRLLFAQSSFTSPNDFYIARGLKTFEEDILNANESSTPEFKGKIEQITRFTAEALEGKDLDQGEDFWFKGALDRDVHGWVLKPKGFSKDDKKKWPVAFLIHGGPQSAWEDQWSDRWNPNSAYSSLRNKATSSLRSTPLEARRLDKARKFTDAIAGDWGGKPFVDLRAGWKHIQDTYPQIDTDRAVAAGASWGGYAINWIQGHPEGFNFKALVCHDGVFDSTYNGYSTEELFFFNHEWGGRPWEPEAKALSEKFSPFVANWSTPQLLIHGSKDYRLPETESIGAFHALQQLNVPTRLIVFPNENHWVLNHGNSLKWHYEVFKWFDEFVGDRS
ncbi:alpha/beta-hydrolase [Mycena galopus ATCC 62051]|nr:alpha/beta-hydrolase [Mycena galopus ATCC 62051]